MAKWGEGDPRWIVEERPDAVNVNNWHWTEKNACGWSKDKFKELFVDFKILHDQFKTRVTEIEKMDGEANANNRKGKLIFFYEWELTLKFKGKVKSSDDYVTGKIVIPNLSEENDLHEIEVNITVNEKTEDAQKLKELMHKHSRDTIREQLGKYLKSLKEEFAQGMILPKKGEDEKKASNAMNNLSSGMETKMQMNAAVNSSTGKTGNGGAVKLQLSNLQQTLKFQCTSQELYNTLTVTELVSAFTHGPAKLEVKPGGSFELFGGNIHGEFIELVPGRRIVQKWRVKSWPDGIFSTVTMELKDKQDHTELKIIQEGLPTSEYDTTKENWDRYYWDPIKRTFGFGVFL